MMEQTAQRRLVLASGSPRRRELLAMLDVDFDILATDVDETLSEPLSPDKAVEVLARRKAEAARDATNSNIVIISADTMVSMDDELLGKPNNEEDAYHMLKRLQGNTHDVFTGICVIDTFHNCMKIEHVHTRVHMRPRTDAFIKWYIQTAEPMDKAGAYGIQGKGSLFVDSIEGDYYNVVGLPIVTLAEMLESIDLPLHTWMA